MKPEELRKKFEEIFNSTSCNEMPTNDAFLKVATEWLNGCGGRTVNMVYAFQYLVEFLPAREIMNGDKFSFKYMMTIMEFTRWLKEGIGLVEAIDILLLRQLYKRPVVKDLNYAARTSA